MAREEEIGGSLILKCPFDGQAITVTTELFIRKAVSVEEQLTLNTTVVHSGCVFQHHGSAWYVNLKDGGEHGSDMKRVVADQDSQLAAEATG